MGKFMSLATIATLLIPLCSCVPYVTTKGANFAVSGTNERFDIIGVDYQPGGSSGFSGTSDPLSDGEACLRDAILMQQLGVNTIRVYNVDANVTHDACASVFNDAGIYMIIDVNSGLYGQYIDRADPSSTYTEEYLVHVFQVIEAFKNYPNTLGFWAANEIINQNSTSDAPAYIRAVVRDMKDYISYNVARPIGVGYSAADVETLLQDTWDYLACSLDDTPSSKIDFFGLNDYEWCGDSSFTTSGYNNLVTMFGEASIPVFFSEYGCNKVLPRTFTEVGALYGDAMSVLSGGLVYEWTQEVNNFGLVDLNSSSEVTLLSDYTYLQEEFAAIDLKSREVLNATAESMPASTCTTAGITGSDFPTTFSLPARPTGVDSYISSGGVTAASTGALVSVTATTMPASVYNYTGSTVGNLALVQLACNDYNSPGLAATYKSTSASCSYATGKGSGPSQSGSGSGSKNGASKPVFVDMRWAVAAAAGVFGLAICL